MRPPLSCRQDADACREADRERAFCLSPTFPRRELDRVSGPPRRRIDAHEYGYPNTCPYPSTHLHHDLILSFSTLRCFPFLLPPQILYVPLSTNLGLLKHLILCVPSRPPLLRLISYDVSPRGCIRRRRIKIHKRSTLALTNSKARRNPTLPPHHSRHRAPSRSPSPSPFPSLLSTTLS
jgi:hypothetical protein